MSDTIIFRKVCARCDKTLSEETRVPEPWQRARARDGVLISHGYCPECAEKRARECGLEPSTPFESEALGRAINNVVRFCYQHRAQRLGGAA